jgi:hypothetical protein
MALWTLNLASYAYLWYDLKGPLIKYFISGPFLIVSCSPAIDKIVATNKLD